MEKTAVEKLYNDLGLKYEAAYGNDITLHKIVQKWLNPRLRARGRHVHGIDLSPGMISLCRQQVPNGSFEVMDMLDFELTMPYDGIVASLSLFELDRSQLTSMSAKWFRWMQPGGILLIATLSAEDCEEQVGSGYWHRDGEYACVEWKFMGRDVVVSLFTRAGWKEISGNAGFEISYTESDLFVLVGAVGVQEERYYIIAKRPSRA